jgi:hypothetical protein
VHMTIKIFYRSNNKDAISSIKSCLCIILLHHMIMKCFVHCTSQLNIKIQCTKFLIYREQEFIGFMELKFLKKLHTWGSCCRTTFLQINKCCYIVHADHCCLHKINADDKVQIQRSFLQRE